MYKTILGLILAFIVNIVHANVDTINVDTINVDTLSQQDKAELISKLVSNPNTNTIIEKLSDPNTNTIIEKLSDPDEASKWVKLGENLGKALGGTAKELGVQAQEFAKTDIGKLVGLIIIFKTFGSIGLEILVHLIGIVLLPILTFLGINFHKSIIEKSDIPNGELEGYRVAYIMIVIVMLIIEVIAIFTIG